MVRKSRWFGVALVLLLVAIAFALVQLDMAIKSVRFDLRLIGESVYEAHTRHGRWPTCLEDMDQTAYLQLPYRKAMLEEGRFVLVWNRELAEHPAENGQRVLAYHNSGLLSRFGGVWVCRGDLQVAYIKRAELQRLLDVAKE